MGEGEGLSEASGQRDVNSWSCFGVFASLGGAGIKSPQERVVDKGTSRKESRAGWQKEHET